MPPYDPPIPAPPPPGPIVPTDKTPSYSNPSLWEKPSRRFGNARFFRTSVTNTNNLNTTNILLKAEEWKIASICVNPNTTELISAANKNLTESQKKDFIKRIYPDSKFYGVSDPILYQDILLNPFLVTSSTANTTSKDWNDILNFWAYPNGEFLPVTSLTNVASYVDVWDFPPERGNPQRPIAIDTRYVLIKNQGQVFEVTKIPTVVRFGTNETGITKIFNTLGSVTCDVNDFGADPAPSKVKDCYELVAPINNQDDILALYPKPPDTRQTATKPIVRYASVEEKSNQFNKEPWIYLRYFRNSYNASDMQCAISKKPVNTLFNKQYLTLFNGFSFTDNSYIEIEKDPNLFKTDIVLNADQLNRKIEVTCNPSLIGTNRNPTSEYYVQTMLKYCGAGPLSMYTDSYIKSGADSNSDRKDEDGNALGVGTLDRWNSGLCQNFTRDNLVKSSENFKTWCTNIENWTEGGGCYNMANAVTPETQNSVNTTLLNLCKDNVLDAKPCLQYCFAKNTDNLDCSTNLGNYCRKLVVDAIQTQFPSSTFSSNTQTVTQLPVILHKPDGYEITLRPSIINNISQKVIKDHPQCSCFMPIESFRAFYDQLTEDFPPSPELNAFILNFYTQPNCSYTPCVFEYLYKPRGVTIPVLKDVASVTNLICPEKSHLKVETVEPNSTVPEKLWLYRCKADKNEDTKKYVPSCPYDFNLLPTCKGDNNGIACTNDVFHCTKTTQYIGGQCPNIIFCVQNAVFQVELTGVKAKVNVEGEVSLSNECDLKLSKFNRYVDTLLLSQINSNQSLYDLCYSENGSNVITLPTQRAQSTGAPVSTPRVKFMGFFERVNSNMQLVVVSILSGDLPNPSQNPTSPTIPISAYANSNIVGEYVTFGTRITQIGLTNGGTLKNLHTFLVSGQAIPLGNESNPVELIIENDPPTFNNVAPEYVIQGSNRFTPFTPMDFVHVYESNAWLTWKNTVPTKFKGKLLKDLKQIEIDASSVIGPLGPGKLSALNGLKKETFLKEEISKTPLVWSYDSIEPYQENVGIVDMYVTNNCIGRYFSGYVKQVNDFSLDIVCMETNESENQLNFSYSPSDYRSLNASGQLATHWVITKDGDDQYVPSGDKVDENTWDTVVEPNPTKPSITDPTKPGGIVGEEFFPREQIKTTGSISLIVILIVVVLVIIAIVMIILVARKKK